jgi:hypothetical protein
MMKLFRYRTAIVNTFGEIANSQLWYSRFSELNDPFEGVYINRSGDGALDALLTTMRVCCFSKSHDNLLLWAHYADSHRGLCLEYEVTEEQYKGQFLEVRYTDDLPVVESIPRVPRGSPQEGALAINVSREGAIFLTKGAAWAYEMECRTIVLAKDNTTRGQLVACPGALTAIYFGLRTSPTVMSIVSKLLPEADPTGLFRADLEPERFKLVFSPVGRNTL